MSIALPSMYQTLNVSKGLQVQITSTNLKNKMLASVHIYFVFYMESSSICKVKLLSFGKHFLKICFVIREPDKEIS